MCHLSVTGPSVFNFQMITCMHVSGFSPNFVCALILWRPDLGLLMGNFCQFLTELSAHHLLYYHFQTITSVNINAFSPDLVCALMLWRCGLGLLMGKCRQFLQSYLPSK